MAGPASTNPAKRRRLSIAAVVTILFLVTGAVWIVLTDVLLYRFVSDRIVIARLETAKGWLFVAFSAAVIYGITRRAVSSLARSDATIRAVVNSIADGVLIVDRHSKIVDANPASARMLGVEDPASLVGLGPEEFARRYHVTRPDGSLVAPDDLIMVRALHSDEPLAYKVLLYPPGRPERVLICTAAAVRSDPGGPVDFSVCVMHDVTALETVERARDQFFSAAAHALKTPVTIIKAHIHLAAIKRTSLDHSATAIERQCGKIDRLTENIVVLARLRSGSLRLRPRAVDAAEVVDAVGHEMKAASVEHSLVQHVTAHPIVFVDRDRMVQVVRNLIEIAYRRSQPRTDVVMSLDKLDSRARIQITYEPLHAELSEPDDGFSGLGLEGYVIDAIVRASSGSVRSEQDDRPRHTDWIEIPTMESPANA